MATPKFGFTTVEPTDKINIPSSINTPLNEIDAAMTKLSGSSEFVGKHVMSFWDSWGTTNGTTENSQIEYQLQKYLGCIMHVSAISGRGYTNQGGTPGVDATFIASLNEAYEAGYEWWDEVAYVVVYGSINDHAATPTAIQTAVQNFVARAREVCPTAEVIIIPPIAGYDKNLPSTHKDDNGWYKTYYNIKHGAQNAGARVIEGGYTLMSFNNYMDDTGLHLTAAGVDAVSKAMAQAFYTGVMKGDTFPLIMPRLPITFTKDESVTDNILLTPLCYIFGSQVFLEITCTVNVSRQYQNEKIGTLSFNTEVFNGTLNKMLVSNSVVYIQGRGNTLLQFNLARLANNNEIPVNLISDAPSGSLSVAMYGFMRIGQYNL